ncbi:MAG: SGNH/GDSL hydrolase family protein [Hyphomicrobiales bacterium]
MKTVLAYGDSLTWGIVPGTRERHAFADRWPNALERELGEGVRVIENGVSGRTTVLDDPYGPGRNGAAHLPMMLSAHAPLDLIVFMLGINDLNYCYGGRAFEAMQGMTRLVEIVRSHPLEPGMAAPQVLLVAPPHLRTPEDPDYEGYFGHIMEESAKLAPAYRRVAGEQACHFFDAAGAAEASPVDGCHLDAENTRALGRALAPGIRKLLEL